MDQKAFYMLYRLFALLCPALMIGQQELCSQIAPIRPFGEVRALIVGISDYQHDKIPDLQYAHRDAEAFARYLTEEAAPKAAPRNVILLTNESATRGNFLSKLESLMENIQEKDRLILYFSGHGDVERVDSSLTGYLLFYDVAPTTYASSGACEVNMLNRYLEKLILDKKVEVILISDACRSGHLAGSSAGGAGATTAALSELFSNTVKMLSCEPDQVSVEGPAWGGGRGLFSYHLVNGLKGSADLEQDNRIEPWELERYVQDSVRLATRRKQLPIIKGPSSIVLARVGQQPQTDLPTVSDKQRLSEDPDTNFLPQLARFESALSKKHLLHPKEGSANEIYETIGDHPAAAPVKKIMKISLAAALQDEAQQALNEYIVSPGRELARRWANADIYAAYPDYLARAAELLGQENYFYRDISSREHYFRGVNLRMQADAGKGDKTMFGQALSEQQTALQLQPIAPHIHNEMGLLYKRLGQSAQAISEFQQALNLSPKWSLALTNLASTYQAMEQYPAAEQIYKDAIQLDTTFALSHYNLARLYMDMQRLQDAKTQLEKTIRHDPQFAEAYFNLAWADVSDPKAEAYLLQYIRLQPSDPDGFKLLGYVYLHHKQFEKALQAYGSAQLLDPGSYSTINSLVYVYKQLKNYEAARQLLEQYIKNQPEHADARYHLAGLLAGTGAQSDALEALRSALGLGYRDYDQIMQDEDLTSLRNLPAFKELLKSYFPDRE